MYVMRPIAKTDLSNLVNLAMNATLGITSLPKNQQKLEVKLERAVAWNDFYLFLLEDTATKEVGGITGIVSKTGVDEPTHFFQVQETPSGQKILRPVSYTNGPSEICSLFLLRQFRQEGLGKLLSFCRFLFMSQHLERFEPTTIAEMRGVIREDDTSPLWNAFGSRFVNMSLKEAMTLRDQGLFDIHTIIPEYPIYISLLPHAARNVIGKVHIRTKPAMQMLIKQGFHLTNDIDILDGGPKIEAKTAEIKAVRNTLKAKVERIDTIEEGTQAIIGTTDLQFRACEGQVLKLKNGVVGIEKEVAEALGVKEGQNICYYKL